MTADEAREQHRRSLTVLRGMIANAAELCTGQRWVELRLGSETTRAMLDALDDACTEYELEAQRPRALETPPQGYVFPREGQVPVKPRRNGNSDK